jgi:hypothetical protein
MSCKGVLSPVAYLVFGNRLETVPFQFENRAAPLGDLRRRIVREEADGLIVAFRARLDGVVEGEVTLSQFDTVTVIAWGPERTGGRWLMRAQAFEWEEHELSWCQADEQEGELMVPCEYEAAEMVWISRRMGYAYRGERKGSLDDGKARRAGSGSLVRILPTHSSVSRAVSRCETDVGE